MDLPSITRQLAASAAAVEALAGAVSEEDSTWGPPRDAWSIREIVGHLLEEERSDFRVRLDLTLHEPDVDWPPIDPQAAVAAGRYRERELAATLASFRSERARSLSWLRDLRAPDWQLFRSHPAAGRLSAGDLLSSWAAHDLLHLRQMAGVIHVQGSRRDAPSRSDYAGRW